MANDKDETKDTGNQQAASGSAAGAPSNPPSNAQSGSGKTPAPIDPAGEFPNVAAFLRMGYKPEQFESMLEKFNAEKAAAVQRAREERLAKEIASNDTSEYMSKELYELRGLRPEAYELSRAAFYAEKARAEKLKPPPGPHRVKAGSGNLTAYGSNEKRHWGEGEVLDGVSSQDIAHFWKLGVIEQVR
jgi:hypothetical protein